jgi:menaquinone-dependent protoporphyrinogen oxidase
MEQKVLVTYASRAGSTEEIAEVVAADLIRRGFTVDLLPVKQASRLDGYSAVVIGSAVRMGSWLPEAVKFVQQNAAALNRLPTAFFSVHLMNLGEDEASRKARGIYLDTVRKHVQPRHEALFAGVGDMAKVSFIEGLIGKLVKSPEGDFRDWKVIHAWAADIFNN